MYKLNGIFNHSRPLRRRVLDFRAPENQLAVEESEQQEIRSPGIDRMMTAYDEADRAGDDAQKASVLRGLIDEMTAVNKLRGVPVHAHPPLPPQFVDGILSRAGKASEADDVGRALIDNVSPDLRPAVAQKFAMQRRSPLLRSLLSPAPLSLETRRDDVDIDGRSRRLLHEPGGSLLLERRDEDDVGASGVSGVERPKQSDEWTPWSPSEDDDPQHPPFREVSSRSRTRRSEGRIVKPYRRYATPGMVGEDTDLQQADQLARAADAVIRDVNGKVIGNPEIERSDHPFLREFAAAMRRYYSEDGDRAVAGVKTRFDDLSIEARDRYATYDPSSDRIYFSKRFSELSYNEKNYHNHT